MFLPPRPISEFGFYHVFHMLWQVQFIFYFGYMVIAGMSRVHTPHRYAFYQPSFVTIILVLQARLPTGTSLLVTKAGASREATVLESLPSTPC